MADIREFRFTFSVDPDRPEMEQDLVRAIAEGFVRSNEMAIAFEPRRYPRRFEDAALQYIEAPVCKKTKHPCQPVLGAGPLMDAGRETCLGLACLMCAMLRYFNGDSKALVDIVPRMGAYGPIPGKWHAVVVDGRGVVHDPQRIVENLSLGMVAGAKPPPPRKKGLFARIL